MAFIWHFYAEQRQVSRFYALFRGNSVHALLNLANMASNHLFKRIRRLMGWLWAAGIVFSLLYLFLIEPELLSPEYMAARIKEYEGAIWGIYITLSIGRILLMLPPTPFLILGIVLFPDSPFFVAMVILFSVTCSTTFFYYVAGNMGWHEFFEKKYPKQRQKIQAWMEGPRAIWIILFWAFLPITPTDLMAYVGGIVSIRFRLLLPIILIGQIPLMLIYIYLGELLF